MEEKQSTVAKPDEAPHQTHARLIADVDAGRVLTVSEILTLGILCAHACPAPGELQPFVRAATRAMNETGEDVRVIGHAPPLSEEHAALVAKQNAEAERTAAAIEGEGAHSPAEPVHVSTHDADGNLIEDPALTPDPPILPPDDQPGKEESTQAALGL